MNMPSQGSQMRRRLGVVILTILVGHCCGNPGNGKRVPPDGDCCPLWRVSRRNRRPATGRLLCDIPQARRSPRTLVEKTTYLVAVSLTLLGGYAAIGDLAFVLGVRLGPKRVPYVEDLVQPRHADGRRVSPAFREFEARTFLFWYSLRVQAVKTPWDAGNEERRSVLGSKLTSVPVLPRAWLELAVDLDAYADVESGLKRASRDVELGVGLQQTDIGLAKFVSENSWPSLAQISYEANRNSNFRRSEGRIPCRYRRNCDRRSRLRIAVS